MDDLERAVFALIKAERGVKKSGSRRDPFGKITVKGKRPTKAAVTGAIRSLSKEGHIRVISHRFDTTYLPAARHLRKPDDVRNVLEEHIEAVKIDLRILSDRVDESTVESLRELDDVLAVFSKASKNALKRSKD